GGAAEAVEGGVQDGFGTELVIKAECDGCAAGDEARAYTEYGGFVWWWRRAGARVEAERDGCADGERSSPPTECVRCSYRRPPEPRAAAKSERYGCAHRRSFQPGTASDCDGCSYGRSPKSCPPTECARCAVWKAASSSPRPSPSPHPCGIP